jgi:predicted methyltransferase
MTAEAAGFKFLNSSTINANLKDSHDHPAGVWTLPPRLKLQERDQEKYLSIGESDRMTISFIKP